MLVFAFLIGLDEGQWNTLPEVTSVQITLSLIFSTFVSLDLVVNADLARSTGVLAFDKLHRKEKAHMVIANLAILSLVTGLVFYWNLKLNADVYQQSTAFSQKAISAFMGALFTFLGLSLARVKAWVATFTEIVAVVRYPELHLNLTLYRGFSSPIWSILLLIGTLSIASLIYNNWSVRLPHDNDWKVYDSQEKKLVEYSRVYLDDLNEKYDNQWRFWVVCKESGQHTDEVPMPLAYVKSYSRIDSLLVKVRYYKGRDIKTPERILDMTAIEWIKQTGMSSGIEFTQDVEEVLCSPQTTKPKVTTSDRKVDVTRIDDEGSFLLDIRDQSEFNEHNIKEWEDAFKKTYFKMGRRKIASLYPRRDSLVKQGMKQLQKQIESVDGLVSLETLKHVSLRYIDEMDEGSRPAFERSLQLKSLWLGLYMYLQKNPNVALVEMITDSLTAKLAKGWHWRIERAMMEFLLELQSLTDEDEVIHKAILNTWSDLPDSTQIPKLYDYLVVAAMSNILEINDSEQFVFFQAKWQPMKDRLGRDNLLEYLEYRERWERSGQKTVTQLSERLKAFRRRQNLQRPSSVL